MSSDLHNWNLQQFCLKKSIQEKFLTWVDRKNKIEIDEQIKAYLQLLPHLGENNKFSIDTKKLYMLKGQ